MADSGVRGRLPAWPRKALNNSVISAEQAYRKRSSLPLLSDAEIEPLRAGVLMSGEGGEGPPPPAAKTPAAPVASAPPAATPAPPAAVAVSGNISPEVAKQVAAGKKWSKSSIAAENPKRKRNGVAPLNDAEITALLGDPAAPPPAAPAAAATAPVARTAAPTPQGIPVNTGTSVARAGDSIRYVGTPAVGTSKAAKSGGVAAIGPEDNEVNQQRRRFAWAMIAAFLTAWFLAFFRFFLPRTLFEPATSFKVGYPQDYGLGVDTRWQQKYRIWVDRRPDRLFVIR